MELLLLIIVCCLLFGADATKGCLFGVIKIAAFVIGLIILIVFFYGANSA